MRFYLNFGFWRLVSLLIKKRWIFSKVVKVLDFRTLSGWIEKYKPALSKSDSSWDNSYCVRLVIVLLAVNIGKLQSFLTFSVENITISAAISCCAMLQIL